MQIRAPKDFWSGIMFLGFAATAVFAARGYSLGTAGKMGPGYFPFMLAGVLAIIGTILLVRAFAIAGEPVGRIHVLPLAIIALGVVFFGATITTLGLVVALAGVMVLAAVAGRQSGPLEVAALVAVVVVFSAGIFVFGLRLSLPLWPAIG
jgi:hypothetical protein